jgi:N5-hydroxyornithine acetyltransferase
MAPSIVHLPNGQNLTVTPVFGGLYFKSNELSSHHAPFPPGWTVVINTEDEEEDEDGLLQPRRPASEPPSRPGSRSTTPKLPGTKRNMVHRFTRPTMNRDHLFISSISQPSSSEYKPVSSPTRQIAMMLWATLWWYFHQPEPDLRIHSNASKNTAPEGKPKGEWRITVNREGVFKSKVVLPKLERMGLIASEESSVTVDCDERTELGWLHMFVSRRAFWQLDARIYLFTMAPTSGSPYPPGTPHQSRPSSPTRDSDRYSGERFSGEHAGLSSWTATHSPGPFHSSSHLPTYYPPAPPQFVRTNGVVHPIRPKPPRQGETFYTRFIPSVGQYLSFRVPSLSTQPQLYRGPVSAAPILGNVRQSISDTVLPTISQLNIAVCDIELLHGWMNDQRVAHFWGEQGPQAHQEDFLKKAMQSRHSFPVMGCWDGRPFGYFEIYWVKEDTLGRYLPGETGNYDRGIHALVGEQEFRGRHRVKIWLSALVHYCWQADLRTEVVMMEPRVDNEK